MKPIRFLQIGDLHIGTAFRGSGFPKQLADRRSHELLLTFRKACEAAVQQQADFMVIAGDLFESHFVDPGQIKEIIGILNELAPLPVFITPGNHDPVTVDSPYRQETWGEHVHIFDAQLTAVEVVAGRCRLWGYGYPASSQRENPYRTLRLHDSSLIEVVVIHGSVDGPEGSPYLPLSRTDLKQMGADYTVLAHYHTRHIVWEEGGKARAAYAGSLEPLGFDELGEHGAFLVEADKGGAHLQWLPLAKRQYAVYDLDVSDCESGRDITRKAQAMIPAGSWTQNLLRIRLVGTLDAGIELEPLKREWQDKGFFMQVSNQTQLDYDPAGFAPDSIHGRFVKLLQARIAAETDEKQKEILQLALTAGLDALTYGRVIDR